MYVKEIIIGILIVIIASMWIFRRKLSNNRNTINEARDNNSKSKDINRQTSDIVVKLESENIEASRLNESIRADNKTAKDIFKQIRNQKLD